MPCGSRNFSILSAGRNGSLRFRENYIRDNWGVLIKWGEPEPWGSEIENPLDFSYKCHHRECCYHFSFASQPAFPRLLESGKKGKKVYIFIYPSSLKNGALCLVVGAFFFFCCLFYLKSLKRTNITNILDSKPSYTNKSNRNTLHAMKTPANHNCTLQFLSFF